MSKLEIKHLAPYLQMRIDPLKIQYNNGVYTLDGLSGAWNVDLRQAMLVTENVHVELCKPLLRRLVDLTTIVAAIDEKYTPLELIKSAYNYPTIKSCVYNSVYLDSEFDFGGTEQAIGYGPFDWLFKHKFDVFGLIDQGLALDINIGAEASATKKSTLEYRV